MTSLGGGVSFLFGLTGLLGNNLAADTLLAARFFFILSIAVLFVDLGSAGFFVDADVSAALRFAFLLSLRAPVLVAGLGLAIFSGDVAFFGLISSDEFTIRFYSYQCLHFSTA
jgi:hypothetical protein